MSEGAKTLRLSKVAKEFNLSVGKIVEFLVAKGHPLKNDPNGKIVDEEYKLLLKEFSSDKSAKEEAESVTQTTSKLKRETIILDDLKPKKQKEDDQDEVVIKDLTAAKGEAAEAAEPAKPIKKAETSVEPETVKQEVESLDGPKVLGKVNLDSLSSRGRPDKKAKKEPEKKETKEEPKAEAPVVEKPAAPLETPVEEVKEEFLETKYEKLERPKILGKVELPVAREKTP